MTSWFKHSAVLLALLHAPSFAQQPAAASFHTNVDLVQLDVSVKDAKRGRVAGLAKENFRVYENGKEYPIRHFNSADEPVTVGLVVDASGSMRTKQPEVVGAAVAFIEASNPLDELFVVNFNDAVRHGLPSGVPFSSGITMLRAALWRAPASGRTVLYDAVISSLDFLSRGRHGRKALVVLSDGGDTASKHKRQDLVRAVKQSRATIYSVGIYDEQDPDRDPKVLSFMARETGGEAYFPEKLGDTEQVCKSIARDMRERYTIAYVPGVSSRILERRIKVSVTAPGGRKLTAHTRRSYEGVATP